MPNRGRVSSLITAEGRTLGQVVVRKSQCNHFEIKVLSQETGILHGISCSYTRAQALRATYKALHEAKLRMIKLFES